MSRILSFVLVPLLCFGCTQKTISNPSPEASKAENSDRALLDAAGYGAPMTIVYWPEHVEHTATLIQSWLPVEASGFTKELLDQPPSERPSWLLQKAGKTLGLFITQALPGIDESRPIVVSLGRTLLDWEYLAKSLLVTRIEPTAATQTRIVLPSTDVDMLSSALQKVAKESGLSQVEGELRFANTWLLFHIEPGKDFVVVELLIGNQPAKIPSSLLVHNVKASPTDRLLTLGADAGLRIHLRYPAVVQSVGSIGMMKIAGAYAVVEPAMREAILQQGISELLAIRVLSDPRARNAESGFLTVPNNSEFATLQFTLTENGHALFASALGDQKQLPLSSLSVLELSQKAVFFPGLVRSTDPEKAKGQWAEVRGLIERSGFGALLYLAGPNSLLVAHMGMANDTQSTTILRSVFTAMLGDAKVGLHGRVLSIATDLKGAAADLEVIPGAASAQEICLYQAQKVLFGGLSALTSVANEDVALLAESIRKEVEPSLKCAEEQGTLKVQVEVLRTTLGLSPIR